MNEDFKELARIASVAGTNFAILGEFSNAVQNLNQSGVGVWESVPAMSRVYVICEKKRFAFLLTLIRKSNVDANYLEFIFLEPSHLPIVVSQTSNNQKTIGFDNVPGRGGGEKLDVGDAQVQVELLFAWPTDGMSLSQKITAMPKSEETEGEKPFEVHSDPDEAEETSEDESPIQATADALTPLENLCTALAI